MVLDPDEQVQSVVRLIFDKFEQLESLNALLQYLVHHNIRLGFRPHYGLNRGQLEWRRPNRPTLQNILHHPIYAGAYSYGRRAIDPRRKIPGRPSTGRTVVAAEECAVLLKDRLPAYISWERYEANIEKLARNRARAASLGAPREGTSLLGGLLVCGRCGCRMVVGYREAGRNSCQIAQALNQEGFRPPKRRDTYNAPMVRQLLSRNLRTKAPRQPSVHLDTHEWFLADLAHELQMPQATLHHWLRRGWVEARKLDDGRGRWVLWADRDEIQRLRKLRITKQGWPDRPYPESLTKPKRQGSV